MARDENVVVEEDLALFMSFGCLDSTLVEFFNIRQILIVHLAAERSIVRSNGAAESGGSCRHGLSTDSDEMLDELAKSKAALRNGSAEIGP